MYTSGDTFFETCLTKNVGEGMVDGKREKKTKISSRMVG